MFSRSRERGWDGTVQNETGWLCFTCCVSHQWICYLRLTFSLLHTNNRPPLFTGAPLPHHGAEALEPASINIFIQREQFICALMWGAERWSMELWRSKTLQNWQKQKPGQLLIKLCCSWLWRNTNIESRSNKGPSDGSLQLLSQRWERAAETRLTCLS